MKMVKPQMQVVHFNESDVIVASGGGSGYVASPTSMLLSNFGDGVANNGIISHNGTDYLCNNRNAGQDAAVAIRNALGLSGGWIDLYPTDSNRIKTSVFAVGNGEANSGGFTFKSGKQEYDVNGIYTYNGNGGFIKQ